MIDSATLLRGVCSLVGGDAALPQQIEQVWQDQIVELAAETSSGTLVVAEGSGHNINLEKPGVVIDAIRDIVDQVRGE